MTMNTRLRFSKDVEYDLLVPPYGQDYYSMTPKQVKDNFEWFISKIPERIDYLINRCAKDLKVSVDKFDYSPESLKLIWRWLLKTVKIEKVPKDQLDEMVKQWGHLGKESKMINYEQLTVASQFIIRDIGMYLGEVYTNHFPTVTWGYFTKPKNNVFANRPVLFGIFVKASDLLYNHPLEPIYATEGLALNVIDKKQSEMDLYDFFLKCVNHYFIFDKYPEGIAAFKYDNKGQLDNQLLV